MEPDEVLQRQQRLNEQILDKVAEDPAFREQLKSDPESALSDLGIAQEIEELERELDPENQPEVAAHCGTRYQGCAYWSTRWYCPGYGWKTGPWISTR